MLRSSSLDSLGELADKFRGEMVEEGTLSNVSLTEPQQGESAIAGQDYTEDMSLHEINAKIIYRLFVWECESKQHDHELVVCEAPASNTPAKFPYLKKLSLFASTVLQAVPAVSSSSAQVENILTLASQKILLPGNGQRLMITSIGSDMLRHHCKDDNPRDPSVLFDAIVVGTMVLTLAVDDAVDDLKGESAIGHLYPVTLDNICELCEINRRYAAPQSYLSESPLLNHVVQYLILQLGYLVLIDKSLPFNAELALEFFSGLTRDFPVSRFDKYKLGPVDVSPTDKWINYSGVDVAAKLLDGEIYDLRLLRKCATDGVSEEKVFQSLHDVFTLTR